MAERRRGTMIPKGPNDWLLRVYKGKTPAGKRIYASRKFEGTTAQARVELTKLAREIDTKTHVKPSAENLAAYLETWLAGKIDVTERTRVSYARMLGYTSAGLGHVKLGALGTTDIQTLLSSLELSPRTVQYIHRVLYSALDAAVKQGLLVRNPAEHVTLPKKRKRKPTVFSVEQMNLFLEITSDSPWNLFWLVLLTSGLRPAEAGALMWPSLNLEDRWLSVVRVIEDDGHGKQSLSNDVKADSRRTIGIPQTTADALAKHKRQQAAAILANGPDYLRLGLVFANTYGGLIDLHHVRKMWKADLKAANMLLAEQNKPLLPIIRLYDTRHTHFTQLLAGGADISWIQKRAGHSDIKMTADNYAHVLPETHREMGERTERMLRREAR